MPPPFSSTNYDIINIGSSQIIDRGIKGIDIGLATIDISNLSASCIASLSGGGGGLTANSVDSSHIINGSILAEDICNNTITGSKIADGTITGSKIADNTITYNKLIPFGIIRIINQSVAENEFDYDLYVYNTTTSEYDSLASAIRLKKDNSFSHFYQVGGFYTTMKLIVSGDGIGVGAFNMVQGAENVNDEDGELIFQIGSSTNYQNIEIGVEVYV